MAKAAGITLKQVANFKALVGRGAQADLDGRTVYVGNLRLFEELGHGLAPYEPRLAELERQGRTVMLVGTKDELYGMIAVADTLRGNSRDAVKSLRASGMRHIAMLTGDNNRVAGGHRRTARPRRLSQRAAAGGQSSGREETSPANTAASSWSATA